MDDSWYYLSKLGKLAWDYLTETDLRNKIDFYFLISISVPLFYTSSINPNVDNYRNIYIYISYWELCDLSLIE